MSFLRRSIPLSSDPASVKCGLEELERLRREIQDRIKVLEELEVSDNSDRQHLGELREIAQDAEDVLDEWEYELLRDKVEGANKRRRGGASDQAARLLADDAPLRDRMASQIGEIMSRYKKISYENRALRFRKGDGARRRGPSQRPPSSSLVDDTRVFGRDNDKDKLVDYMLSDECVGSKPTVIPIMGLLGKTTLAQHIYNDTKVVNCFKRGWVYMRRDFDLKTLLQRVIEALTLKSCCCDQLDAIQSVLRQSLSQMDKKFLLVLDDVCREHQRLWYDFERSLCSGLQGSVVLLTTKITEVAEMTKTVPVSFYLFDRISDECCWKTFIKYAFDGQDVGEGTGMVDICERVVKLCDGVPLVAKSLGVSFRKQGNKGTWMDSIEDIVEEEIVPALQSGYQLLPHHLKPCLLYCSLFPKGYLFKKGQLVRLWMAQGLILSENREWPEDVGIKYCDELISRSFLLQSENDEEAYFIPKLIYDLIYSISSDEHCRTEDTHNLPPKARHVSLALRECKSSESFYNYTGLRSFMVMQTFPLIHIEIKDEMFHKLNRLRSLDLSYTNIQILPNSIGNLKHLRFLALNGTKIRLLPESICKLYNLQIFELKGCSCLRELPRAIGSLINLRHLDVDGSGYLLTHLPPQIQKLTSLQKLPTVNLHKGNEFCGIRELQDLVNLRELGISGLCNVTNLDDAKKANLQKKIYLKSLKLIWSPIDTVPSSEQFGSHEGQNILNLADETDEEDGKSDDIHNNARDSVDEKYSTYEKPSACDVDDRPDSMIDIPDEQESNFNSIKLRDRINVAIQDSVSNEASVGQEDLLENLCPSTNLETLCIKSYGGSTFPNWIGDVSFHELIDVELVDCKCVMLPPLGQLPNLMFLSIDHVSVEQVGMEFCGSGNTKAFPKLETLSFHNMNKWKNWGGVEEDNFPNLNKLCLFNCPQLSRVPYPFSSLKRLEVERCTELTDIPELPSLEVLDLHHCDGLTAIPMLTSLHRLTMMCCQKLKSLCPLPNLANLWIENCEQLTSIVFCSCCPSSAVLSCKITDLEHLFVANCHQLCCSPKEPLIRIQSFAIDGCLILSNWKKTQGNNQGDND